MQVKTFLISLLFVCGSVFAQQTTTPNLIGNGVGYGSGEWQNIGAYTQLNGQLPTAVFGCCISFGSGVLLDTSTSSPNGQSGQLHWSYGLSTVQQVIAINQALSGTGIRINGYNWGYEVRNANGGGGQGGVDSLTASTFLKDNTGSTVLSDTRTYNTTSEWNWYGGTVTSATPITNADQGQLGISFTSIDSGYWAGYYGPQVRNVSMGLNYTVDACASNPLSDPSCPGYAAAYQTQQCSINPLYSPSCPNYTTAQCSINPLYSTSCSGYSAAYLTQQCNLDGLYSTSCPNYAEAYAKKNILSIDTTGTSSPTQTTNTTSKTEATTKVSSDGKIETSVSKTGDSNVDSVIEAKATSASPGDATATVQLTPPSGGSNVSPQTNTKTETKTETKAASSSNQQQTTKTARTERNEQKSGTNEGKSNNEMKQAAQQKAKEEMKRAEVATSFEGQVAIQQNVIGAMSFVPGFASYAKADVPDVLQRQLQRQYGKDVVDNRANRRMFSGSDKLHEEMVSQQYR